MPTKRLTLNSTWTRAPRRRADLDHYLGHMDNTHGTNMDSEPAPYPEKQPNWIRRSVGGSQNQIAPKRAKGA